MRRPSARDLSVVSYAPEDYDSNRRYPLLVLLHDDWQAPSDWLETGGIKELANEEGFLVIIPDGASELQGPFGKIDSPLRWASAWRHGNKHGSRELKTVRSALDEATLWYCVDRSRIFVLGHGHGGAPAYNLSCEPWVTGIATSAHHYNLSPNCSNTPKPFLLLFPDANGHMPADGSPACATETVTRRPSYEDMVAKWRPRNRCETTGRSTTRSGGTCTEWACETPFSSCLYHGGRPWPGGKSLDDCGGQPPADFDPGRVAWEFFETLKPLEEDQQFQSE